MNLEPDKKAAPAPQSNSPWESPLNTSLSPQTSTRRNWQKPAGIVLALSAGGAGAYTLSQHEFKPEPLAAVAALERTRFEAATEKLDVAGQFEARLDRLNEDMGAFRTEMIWSKHQYGQLSNIPRGVLQNELEKFGATHEAAKNEPYFEHLQPLLEDALVRLPALQAAIEKIKADTPADADEVQDFNDARGFFRAFQNNWELFHEMLEEFKESPEFNPDADLRPRINGARAVIVQPNLEPVSGEITVPMHINDLLFELNFLSDEERQALTRRIIENERTRVIGITAVEEPGYSDKVFYIEVEQLVDLRTETKWVPLTLRQTTERFNTDSLAKKIGVALGRNTEAGLIIRNTLYAESDVSDFLSTSNYNTCLSVFADPENPEQTKITFADDIELTFYKKASTSFLDVAFRAVARSTSARQLEGTRDITLRQAAENMQGIAAEGGDFLTRVAGLQP